MATERQKEIKRRRQRKGKLRKLKIQLAQSNDPKDRDRLIEKIKRISIRIPEDLPEV